MNQSGWIHTRNDRSGVPGWVSPEYLQQQISVATLAVVSISAGESPAPQASTDIVLPLVLIAAVIVAVAALAVWYRRH
jgi:hypothetical protein